MFLARMMLPTGAAGSEGVLLVAGMSRSQTEGACVAIGWKAADRAIR